MKPCRGDCIRCCGPRKGPTRDALAVQNAALKDELGQAIAAAAITRDADPLPALVEHDLAARLRWRADHLEAQVVRLGAIPAVPPFPGISDPGRWLQQIERARQAHERRKAEEAA